MNKFVEQALTREVSEQERKALSDSFTLLGRDIEESDVEFACWAQAEVALGAYPISRRDLDGHLVTRWGSISADDMDRVSRALKRTLELGV
jgi:hypothetical protein